MLLRSAYGLYCGIRRLRASAGKEENEQALQNVAILFTRPISATLSVIAVLSLFAPLVRLLWSRDKAQRKAGA